MPTILFYKLLLTFSRTNVLMRPCIMPRLQASSMAEVIELDSDSDDQMNNPKDKRSEEEKDDVIVIEESFASFTETRTVLRATTARSGEMEKLGTGLSARPPSDEGKNELFAQSGSHTSSDVPEKWKAAEPAAKRKRRPKEEVEAEKEAKRQQLEEAAQKRRDQKQQKENEKVRARIEREISSSLKSNCEKYVFCHVGERIYAMIESLEAQTKIAFLDRGLEAQLVKGGADLENRIEWHRKCIEAVDKDDETVERFEYTAIQRLFVVVVEGGALAELVNAEAFSEWVEEQKRGFPHPSPRLIVVVYGQCTLREDKMTAVNVNLFMNSRVQLKTCETAAELAQYIVQLTKSVAKLEALRDKGDRLIVDMEKGVRSGANLVEDWWNRMLDAIARMSDAARRAILQKIPSPVKGIDWIRNVGTEAATREIADLVMENNRRIGQQMAHRVITLLADTTGEEIIA